MCQRCRTKNCRTRVSKTKEKVNIWEPQVKVHVIEQHVRPSVKHVTQYRTVYHGIKNKRVVNGRKYHCRCGRCS